MRKARILLIEDEADVLALNQAHLAAQGYQVLCADTLAAARNIIWEQPPDLIVLDVLMPDGDGYDFCAEIREVTSAPILYLTCMDKNENIVRGLMQGGDDYLTKPYSLHVLSARVVARLRSHGFIGAGKVELPPLTVDLLSGRATLLGEEIPLSQKEFQLLACLAGSCGQEFSVAELYETIWREPPGTGSRNVVSVHISNLRKKMRLDESSPFEIRSAEGNAYALFKVGYGQGR